MSRPNTDKVVGDKSGHKDPVVGLHFQLSCYVCGRGCTKPAPFEGWASFTRIFQQRPDGCRFAVARQVPLLRNDNPDPRTPLYNYGQPTGDWLVWDMLDQWVIEQGNSGTLTHAPHPIWRGDNEDGLIMKAMALYERAGS